MEKIKFDKISLSQKINVLSVASQFLDDSFKNEFDEFVCVHLQEINSIWSVLKKLLAVAPYLQESTKEDWLESVINCIDSKQTEFITSNTTAIMLAFFVNEMNKSPRTAARVELINDSILSNSQVVHGVLTNLGNLSNELVFEFLSSSFLLFVLKAVDALLLDPVLGANLAEIKGEFADFIVNYDMWLQAKGECLSVTNIHLISLILSKLSKGQIPFKVDTLGRLLRFEFINRIDDLDTAETLAIKYESVNQNNENLRNLMYCDIVLEGKLKEKLKTNIKTKFPTSADNLLLSNWEKSKFKDKTEILTREDDLINAIMLINNETASEKEISLLESMKLQELLALHTKVAWTERKEMQNSEVLLMKTLFREFETENLVRLVRIEKYKKYLRELVKGNEKLKKTIVGFWKEEKNVILKKGLEGGFEGLIEFNKI